MYEYTWRLDRIPYRGALTRRRARARATSSHPPSSLAFCSSRVNVGGGAGPISFSQSRDQLDVQANVIGQNRVSTFLYFEVGRTSLTIKPRKWKSIHRHENFLTQKAGECVCVCQLSWRKWTPCIRHVGRRRRTKGGTCEHPRVYITVRIGRKGNARQSTTNASSRRAHATEQLSIRSASTLAKSVLCVCVCVHVTLLVFAC